ncbi:MAG: thioredoxin family protein [Emticicia sp.]|uniref:thioredoxin family protein n=1 Tax=Emticicia sp. TaxID=1930953 RepID=UPI003BA43627
MKKMILAMSVCLVVLVYACSRGNVKQISFVKNNDRTMEEMLAQAKSQKKILFVDVYTTWCGPCKWMDENTFADARVAEKFNKTFLNYKVDGDSFEGVNVGIIYRVDSYPTYLFISPEGKVIHRIEGTMSPEGLVQEADFVVNRTLQNSK